MLSKRDTFVNFFVSINSKVIGLLRPLRWIKLLAIAARIHSKVLVVSVSKLAPVLIIERELDVALGSFKKSQTFVPSDMQTVCLISFLKVGLMATEVIIASSILAYFGNVMKRLVNVTNIVNKETQSQRSGCVKIIVC